MVLEALGLASRMNNSSCLIANCIFNSPLTLRAKASFILFSSISLISELSILNGGITAVESQLCTPAGSRCSNIPAINTFSPSEIKSTSISIVSVKNSSTKSGPDLNGLPSSSPLANMPR